MSYGNWGNTPSYGGPPPNPQGSSHSNTNQWNSNQPTNPTYGGPPPNPQGSSHSNTNQWNSNQPTNPSYENNRQEYATYGQQWGYNQPPNTYGPRSNGPAVPQYSGPPPGVDPQIWSWFRAVDSDQSGLISAMELRQALVNGNWSHFNEETCRLMIGMFDRDNNGQIDIHEFTALWNYIQQWRGVFEKYDADRSGFIDEKEFLDALHSMGYRLSPEFARTVIRRFDRHQRYGLSLDSFIQACVQLHGLTEGFKQRDVQRTGVIRVGFEEFLTMVLSNKV